MPPQSVLTAKLPGAYLELGGLPNCPSASPTGAPFPTGPPFCPGQTNKMSPFEEDVRVPLYVRGPGIPAGLKLPHLVTNTDMLPTILDLAGGSWSGGGLCLPGGRRAFFSAYLVRARWLRWRAWPWPAPDFACLPESLPGGGGGGGHSALRGCFPSLLPALYDTADTTNTTLAHPLLPPAGVPDPYAAERDGKSFAPALRRPAARTRKAANRFRVGVHMEMLMGKLGSRQAGTLCALCPAVRA